MVRECVGLQEQLLAEMGYVLETDSHVQEILQRKAGLKEMVQACRHVKY